jgi:hypothetical protein
MSDLSAALMIAIRVHAGQRDKRGEPYLLHVLRVVEAVEGERAKVLAALHDVLEDGPDDLDLEDREMFPENAMWIANSVEVLTRGPNETYAEYIDGIRDGHSSTWVAEIRQVKLAALRDNLGRIPGPELLGSFAPVDRDAVAAKWASLKSLYEKAIDTLEPAAGA